MSGGFFFLEWTTDNRKIPYLRTKQKNMQNAQQPAYPPQVMLDQFQRPVAPFPGFTKLEAAALALLPYFLELARLVNSPTEGISVHAIRDAYYVARNFCEYAEKQAQQDAPKHSAIHDV